MVGKLSNFSGWSTIKGQYISRKHFSTEVLQRLTDKIALSESQHGAEFVLALEPVTPSHINVPRERALEVFGRLGVWDTPRNTGVLLYISFDLQAIEIIADRGLEVDNAEWARICEHMASRFKAGEYKEGINDAINAITEVLIRVCPPSENDEKNWLSDTPVVL
ncbi:TPM domain-containing protein [Brackiella oedipodis]|uniref:TPM domain-containing protein n=1 Tax=Brackiella oedipodis TaxID=124225 RepID=UPI00048B2A92|nr:TPM domain-containing protein [Brackiella oedipodis]